MLPSTPKDEKCNHCTSVEWTTVSNAADISKATRRVASPLSMAFYAGSSVLNSVEWTTVSNAADISKATRRVTSPLSMALYAASSILKSADSVE